MSHQASGIPLIKKVFNTTLQSLKNKPALFSPFIIFAVIQVMALIFLYLIPRMPLRAVFGPIIKTLWNESFLHYPTNFFLLPKLANLSNMALSVIAGSALTGTAIVMIFDVYNKKHSKLGKAFKSALKQYISLFIVVLVFTAAFYIFTKIVLISLTKYFLAGHSRLLFLGARIWMGPILLCINFIIALFIQSAFAYSLPVLMIENKKIINSIVKSFVLFKKFFVPTIALVGLPTLLYIPIIALIGNSGLLIDKFFPEIIMLVLFLSIIVSSLIIDPLITVSTTLLYLGVHEDKKVSQ